MSSESITVPAPASAAEKVPRVEDRIVVARRLVKTYDSGGGAVHALRGLDLDVRRCEMVAVMGPSGCGKTTLLNCLSGIDEFTSGEVWIAGQRLSTLSDNGKTDFRAMQLGVIFQNYNLLPVLKSVENVELPLLVRGDDPKEARGKAIDALAAVGLDQVALKKPAELSGGQQQRVAIARALVNEPDIVFADEPTGNLDSETSREAVELMKSLHAKKGLTFTVVTHHGAAGAVDEIAYAASPDGGRLPFSAQVYDNLTSNLGSIPTVDRVAPRYQLPGAVVDTSSQLFAPAATVIGFDATRDLGNFVRSDGSTWNGSGLSGTEAIINANLATSVEAKVGDGLVVSLGTPRGFVQIPVTVKEIVRDEGRGAWNDGENLFVPLPAFQAALGESGKINTITVANDGGATQ